MATIPAATFVQYVYDNSPGSLRNYWGQRFVGSMIGLLFDTLAEGASHAIRVSKIGSSNFPDDAINLIGQERGFARFTDETTADYTARVADAWTLWRQAGTDGGIIEMFDRAGFTATIIHNRDWDWPDTWRDAGTWGDGGTWEATSVLWGDPDTWGDGDVWGEPVYTEPLNWSRFWVVISDHSWVSEGTWGTAGDWGDGGTWGTDATPDDVRAARQIVNAFKPANAVCVAICIVLDEPTWTSEQTDWYDFEPRSEAARYW